MKATLFHNPSAGDEEHSREALLRLLRDSGLSVRAHSTRGHDLQEGLEEESDLVIVAGGDGTVGKIATQLRQRDRLFAILPLGTANNLARTLGRWDSPEAFAAGWRGARRRRLDVAYAEGPWGRRRFVEAAGFGAFARAVEAADQRGLSGVEAGRAAFRAIVNHADPLRVTMTVEGETVETETLFVEVMNIPLFGPNLPLATRSDPGDGLLDVVTVPPDQRGALMRWLESPPDGSPPVTVRRAREVTVDWPGGPCRLDDECVARDAPMRVAMGIEDAPLQVLVPQEQPVSAQEKAR